MLEQGRLEKVAAIRAHPLGLVHHILCCPSAPLGHPMSQPHFGIGVTVKPTLPKVGSRSLPGLLKTQSSSSGVKTPCIGVFLIPLQRS
jgi:hypothetical protein